MNKGTDKSNINSYFTYGCFIVIDMSCIKDYTMHSFGINVTTQKIRQHGYKYFFNTYARLNHATYIFNNGLGEMEGRAASM